MILVESDSSSWQLIWTSNKERFTVPSARNPEEPASSELKAPKNVANPQQNAEAPLPENEIPAIKTEAQPTQPDFAQHTVSRTMLRLSPLGKLPDAETVLGFVLSAQTRVILGKIIAGKKNHPLWQLLADSIESNAFGKPSKAVVTKPNLRIVLPWAPRSFAQRFDMSRKQDIERVRNEVLPVVVTNREALAAAPEKLPELVQAAIAERAYARRKQIEEQTVQKAVRKMPAAEQEVIAYGTRIWPRISDHGFSYDELCHAIWFFQWEIDQMRAEWDGPNKAMQLRHTVKHLRLMLNGNSADAILEICTAYGKNPKGECKWPMRPINYGIS